MTDYYADFVNGSDANNGLGPDASHATNKPWKTLQKALGAAGIASGDRVYLSPAGPFRETIVVAMTSAAAETKVIGDPENKQGFKTSGAVRVSPGRVVLTGYTTNDTTAASATALFDFAGRDHLTFERILFVGGRARMFLATTLTSTDIKFFRCAFNRVNQSTSAAHGLLEITAGFGVALNLEFDRCRFLLGRETSSILIIATTGTGADWDLNVLIRNSIIVGGSGKFVDLSGSGVAANRGNGVKLRNLTYIGSGTLIDVNDAELTATFPSTVTNSLIIATGAGAAMVARASAGFITENYNVTFAATARTGTGFAQGANSVENASRAPLVEFGQEAIFGWPILREFAEPAAGSPLLGFGSDGAATAYDLRGKPRPAGGGSALPAAGCMERSNTMVKDTAPIGAGGPSALRLVGPGYYEFWIPVGTAAVTVAYTVKWDATYAGTKPQLQVDENERAGVTAETKTATGAAGANETLTLSAFTPTRADFVVVRVISNDTNGGGLLQADNLSIT